MDVTMTDVAASVAGTREVGATLGVEEEFHLVDPASGDLVPAAGRLLRRDESEAEPELQRSVVETATGVHAGLDDLRQVMCLALEVHVSTRRAGA
jgi:gamma-glutamyl:cysteine ligase YbdK (ATP-grasp superfamily)